MRHHPLFDFFKTASLEAAVVSDLTNQERQLRSLLRIWTALFGAGAVFFFLVPSLFTNTLNAIGEVFGIDANPLPSNVERFWNALAVSMMATITYLAYQAQKEIQKARRLIKAILVAKAVSTLAFTASFFIDRAAFAYLAGGLFCDGPIFVITWFLYHRVFRKTP